MRTVLALSLCCLFSFADTAIISPHDIVRPEIAHSAMIAASEPIAAEAGRAILAEGGNAVDAAVTMAFTMAATLPRAGNLGGGGFMVLRTPQGVVEVIDFREMAPAAATRDMYLNEAGDADSEKSRFSHLAVGVPGTVAGLALALEHHGTKDLKRVLAPAIEAAIGFEAPQSLTEAITARTDRLGANAAAAAVFLPQGKAPQPGSHFAQPDLARTLQQIADGGAEAFYNGPFADAISKEMAANGGLVTKADMATYQAIVREPIRGTYRGYDVYSMPPPSSGGVHIVQLLNILSGYDLTAAGHNSAQSIHWLAESMKYAYADRSKYLGDTDFVDVPIEQLTSDSYATAVRSGIAEQARPSEEIRPGQLLPPESNETTHFSIIDHHGFAVAVTYTLNFSFGSGIMVPGTGVLLNNEMDDFSAKAGVPNAYGLLGGEANAVEPGKRMLSSMSPTLLVKDGQVFLATGSPGGSRIITTVLQVILNLVDHGMNLQEAVNAPRVHHQWLPDELRVESGISADTIRLLEARGHRVVEKTTMGAAASVLRSSQTGQLQGAADPRRDGVAVGL